MEVILGSECLFLSTCLWRGMFIEKHVDKNKGLTILDSNIWWSNFPKDVTYISFEYYYGSLSNCVCKILVQ